MTTMFFDLFKVSRITYDLFVVILIMICSKSKKMTNDLFKVNKMTTVLFDLFKVSKMTLLIMTCLEVAVLKVKIDSKSKNKLQKYMLIYLRKAVANRAIHDTFLSLKKVIKNGIWKLWINIYL